MVAHMSTQSLEHDLAQYLAHAGYEVTFRYPQHLDEFHLYVIYDAQIIACRAYRKGTYPQFVRAARWALKRVREHQAAMRILGGLVRT